MALARSASGPGGLSINTTSANSLLYVGLFSPSHILSSPAKHVWKDRTPPLSLISEVAVLGKLNLIVLFEVDRAQLQPEECLQARELVSLSLALQRPRQLRKREAYLGLRHLHPKSRPVAYLAQPHQHLKRRLKGCLVQRLQHLNLKQAECSVPLQPQPSLRLGDFLVLRQQHLNPKSEAYSGQLQLRLNHRLEDYLARPPRHLNHRQEVYLAQLQPRPNPRPEGYLGRHNRAVDYLVVQISLNRP